MTLSSKDQNQHNSGGDKQNRQTVSQTVVQVESENEAPTQKSMRESLIDQKRRPHFLKRFLFTILAFNLVLVPVNAVALNINNNAPESASAVQQNNSPLHQFYFRNATGTGKGNAHANVHNAAAPVVISTNSEPDSSASSDSEPKSGLNTDVNENSAENAISHEQNEKNAKRGQQPAKVVNETSSRPLCDKNGTHAYQHSVEDVLRQIFGADGLDEDELDEDEDDEEFRNEYYQDRDDRYEFERSTNGSSTVRARHVRDINSRRGPLQVDDDESGQSTEEEEDDDPQLLPPTPSPKAKKPAQSNNNNKNRMNPPKQANKPQQQPNRKPQKQVNPKKPQKSPVNPAEKRAETLAKYNAYMDAVFSRMNVLIKKKRMDPLRVNLYAGPNKPGGGNGNGGNGGGASSGGAGNNSGPAKAKNGNRKGNVPKNKKKGKNSQMEDDSGSDDHDEFGPADDHHDEDDDDESSASSGDEERALRSDDSAAVHDIHLDSNVFGRSIRSLLANISQYSHAVLSNPRPSSERLSEEDASHGESELESDTVEEGRGNSKAPAANKNKGPKNRNNGGNGGGQNKNSNKTLGNVGKNKHKFNKNKNKNGPRPTRGILHGLSSLRRDGNVQVVKDGPKARVVRAKFLLGPVALEILPKKGKPNRGGQSRENSDNNVSETSRQVPNPAGSAAAQPVPATDPDSSAGEGGPAPSGSGAAPAATATAPQLRGILEIRLAPNRPTRIRKLRVFPPGNVQVDGDKASGNSGGNKAGGHRKVTPQATARLRQTALQVVRQVDRRLRPGLDQIGSGGGGGRPKNRQPKPLHRMVTEEYE